MIALEILCLIILVGAILNFIAGTMAVAVCNAVDAWRRLWK
jgi:hypothetical protein